MQKKRASELASKRARVLSRKEFGPWGQRVVTLEDRSKELARGKRIQVAYDKACL